ENVYAFLDISQVTTGHTLVIPKVHTVDIYEMDENVASKIFTSVPKIARSMKPAFKPAGLNILNNNEVAAGHSVFHFHLHLIPTDNKDAGFNANWNMRNDEFSQVELQDMANNIAQDIE